MGTTTIQQSKHLQLLPHDIEHHSILRHIKTWDLSRTPKRFTFRATFPNQCLLNLTTYISTPWQCTRRLCINTPKNNLSWHKSRPGGVPDRRHHSPPHRYERVRRLRDQYRRPTHSAATDTGPTSTKDTSASMSVFVLWN